MKIFKQVLVDSCQMTIVLLAVFQNRSLINTSSPDLGFIVWRILAFPVITSMVFWLFLEMPELMAKSRTSSDVFWIFSEGFVYWLYLIPLNFAKFWLISSGTVLFYLVVGNFAQIIWSVAKLTGKKTPSRQPSATGPNFQAPA